MKDWLISDAGGIVPTAKGCNRKQHDALANTKPNRYPMRLVRGRPSSDEDLMIDAKVTMPATRWQRGTGVTCLGALLLCAAGSISAQAGVPRTSTPSPGAEIFLVPLRMMDGMPQPGTPVNVTRRDGYDNQPAFTPDSRALLFTANHGDGHTDIYRYDIASRTTQVARATKPESEYSATMTREGKGMMVIRVEPDSTQRLWQLSLTGGIDAPFFADIKPVGYYAQADDSTWALFVLGSPNTLQVARVGKPGSTTITRSIGRSLLRIPGTTRVSFVQKGAPQWWVMSLDPATGKVDTLVATRPNSEDLAWVDGNTLLTGQGSKLFAWRRGDREWREVASFDEGMLRNITRLAVSPDGKMLAMVADGPQIKP
jgi:hypothetical protein